MSVVAQAFAALAALIHVVVFVAESFLIRRRAIHRGMFRIRGEDVPAVLLWSFGQGFYNLFLAAGTVAGLVAVNTGHETVGLTLVVYTCGFMALSGVVLAVGDALALGRPRNSAWPGVVAQLVPALVVLAIVLTETGPG
ncbi:DUF1304 domain-containing protein [Amycolatopsis rhabdoformis]|uniref:DUF1304 domain-containing protein n=1 Tax=Amycolatopsis rhabdoformis TaxID=1448059 RepID=A0ABZ1IIY9_9PSEU|nr:DUF1304 domain-containing protein [Amycolatopsis rhabdoformis]WSE34252.1 DUF1304 domain-containing protein [Amycolatopsis rhabdoformis]